MLLCWRYYELHSGAAKSNTVSAAQVESHTLLSSDASAETVLAGRNVYFNVAFIHVHQKVSHYAVGSIFIVK